MLLNMSLQKKKKKPYLPIKLFLFVSTKAHLQIQERLPHPLDAVDIHINNLKLEADNMHST